MNKAFFFWTPLTGDGGFVMDYFTVSPQWSRGTHVENTIAMRCEPQVSVTVIRKSYDQSTQPVITAPPHCFHSTLNWEPCQKKSAHQRRDMGKKIKQCRTEEEQRELQKDSGRRTDSRWKKGRSEIRVVFYSQYKCWEKHETIWSESSWKATCCLLIEQQHTHRELSPCFPTKRVPKHAQSCFCIDNEEWVVLTFSPLFVGFVPQSMLYPTWDLKWTVCNNCTCLKAKHKTECLYSC